MTKLVHGHSTRKSTTRLYVCWLNMRNRCENPKNKRYADWGGRGIKVCDRWQDFSNFLADMGEAPKGMTINRLDNDGDYENDNCYWATWKEQANNRRGNNTKLLTFNGKTQCITDWSHEIGLSRNTIANRLSAGWTVARTLTEPSQKGRPLVTG